MRGWRFSWVEDGGSEMWEGLSSEKCRTEPALVNCMMKEYSPKRGVWLWSLWLCSISVSVKRFQQVEWNTLSVLYGPASLPCNGFADVSPISSPIHQSATSRATTEAGWKIVWKLSPACPNQEASLQMRQTLNVMHTYVAPQVAALNMTPLTL